MVNGVNRPVRLIGPTQPSASSDCTTRVFEISSNARCFRGVNSGKITSTTRILAPSRNRVLVPGRNCGGVRNELGAATYNPVSSRGYTGVRVPTHLLSQRRQLTHEEAAWRRYAAAVFRVLEPAT